MEFGRDQPWEWVQSCPGQLCVLGHTVGKFPLLHEGEIVIKRFMLSPSLDALEFSGFKISFSFPGQQWKSGPRWTASSKWWGQCPVEPARVTLRGSRGRRAEVDDKDDLRWEKKTVAVLSPFSQAVQKLACLPTVCQSDLEGPHRTSQG